MKVLSPLRTILIVQLSVCATFSLLAIGIGKVFAYSLSIGMLVFIVPNAYFTYYAFRYRGTEYMPWVRQSFMFGEMGKLSLTAVSFALAFVFIRPLHVGALFVGFIAMIFLHCWLAHRVANSVAVKKPD